MDIKEALKTRHYPFVAQSDGEGWAIHFPDLPGCQTYAETWHEVASNAQAIFEEWVDMFVEEDRALPDPTTDVDEMPWPAELFTGKRLWTTSEVADEINVSVRRVQALARQRGLGKKVGRDLLFNDEEVRSMRVRIPGRPASPPVA
jgi:predicted RNase H-like HicB family nuclease